MFAVVRTGGKQYRVKQADVFVTERLKGEVGTQVVLDDVLMLGADNGTVDMNTDGVVVTAEIAEHIRHDKIIVFKKQRRQNHRSKNGHRQQGTVLKVISIGSASKGKETATSKPAQTAVTDKEATKKTTAKKPTQKSAKKPASEPTSE